MTATALLTAVSPTIVRIRGQIDLAGDLSGAPVMLPWAAGLVQMSRKAFATGIAAVPFPSIDDADWQWYEVGSVGDAGSTTLLPENDLVHVPIDTKAMRRYEQDDQTLVLVVANLSLVATHTLMFSTSLSILIKE